MGRSISPMEEETAAGSDPRAAPQLIVPMSLQLAIPRRVALQQSSPPLHQPSVILKEKRKFEKEKPLNCTCANSKLSQQRGSPQECVPEDVPTDVLGYQVAHPSFLMTSKTSFHNRFVCCLSLQLDISCRARQHNWGSAKSALHLTLNLRTFLRRRCVMNKRRNPFRSWQVSGARTKNMDKSG